MIRKKSTAELIFVLDDAIPDNSSIEKFYLHHAWVRLMSYDIDFGGSESTTLVIHLAGPHSKQFQQKKQWYVNQSEISLMNTFQTQT